jgi:MFS family permease
MSRRDYTLLWSASATSQLGNICSTTANPLLALLLTHSPIFAGWVCAASTVPALLMYLPAGWFVDRCNRRLLMFVGQTGRLVAGGGLVYALWSEHWPAGMVVVAAVCEGTFLVLYNAAEITAVQQVVNTAELPSALALNEARIHIAVTAGKPLGGFLFECNKAFPYCLNLAASIGSIIALIKMKERNYQPQATPNRPGARLSTFAAVKEVLFSPFLRTVVIVCAIGNLVFQTVLLLLLVLAERQHMSSLGIGLLLATSGVGGLAGSMIAPKAGKRVRDERSMIELCVMAWAALTLVVAMSAQPVVGLIAWGGLSVTGGILNVAITTYEVKRVSGHMLGRVMGLVRFVTSGAVALGALLAGYVVCWLQPQRAAWLAFALIASMAFVVLLSRLAPVRTIGRFADRMIGRLKRTAAAPPSHSAEDAHERPREAAPAS